MKVTRLLCPECGSPEHRQIDSRIREYLGRMARQRRRICSDCGHRFNQLEITEADLADILAAPDELNRRIALEVGRIVRAAR